MHLEGEAEKRKRILHIPPAFKGVTNKKCSMEFFMIAFCIPGYVMYKSYMERQVD